MESIRSSLNEVRYEQPFPPDSRSTSSMLRIKDRGVYQKSSICHDFSITHLFFWTSLVHLAVSWPKSETGSVTQQGETTCCLVFRQLVCLAIGVSKQIVTFWGLSTFFDDLSQIMYWPCETPHFPCVAPSREADYGKGHYSSHPGPPQPGSQKSLAQPCSLWILNLE